MSISDELMFLYYRLVTDVPYAEIDAFEKGMRDGSTHPRDIKVRLARRYVRSSRRRDREERPKPSSPRYSSGRTCPTKFRIHRSRGEAANGLIWMAKLLVLADLARANGEARRLIKGGGCMWIIRRSRARDYDSRSPATASSGRQAPVYKDTGVGFFVTHRIPACSDKSDLEGNRQGACGGIEAFSAIIEKYQGPDLPVRVFEGPITTMKRSISPRKWFLMAMEPFVRSGGRRSSSWMFSSMVNYCKNYRKKRDRFSVGGLSRSEGGTSRDSPFPTNARPRDDVVTGDPLRIVKEELTHCRRYRRYWC